MPLNWSTVASVTQASGMKLLVYGDSGLGKTVLSATLGPGSLLISAESGALSLRRANLERLFGVGNPSINYDMPVLVINTQQDWDDIYAWLKGSYEAKSFHSIAVDSISEIAERVLATAKLGVKDPRQAYGYLTEKIETTVKAYRDLPGLNVYMAAKMEPVKDELTGIIRYSPAMPGKQLTPKLPYLFDEVFRLGVNKTPQGESYRFLQTQPDIQHVAKDRAGVLNAIEQPHLGMIFQKIYQGA